MTPKRPSTAQSGVPEHLQPLLKQLVALDESELALVLRALAANEVELGPSENAALWAQWVAKGPQGAIEDEGAPEFP